MCGPTVTSWDRAAEGMRDCFHLQCQAGGWNRIGCTVFMDGSRTLLNSEAPPDWSSVTESSVHTLWRLAVCCFLEREAWSLTLFCLLVILESAFPWFLTGVSRGDTGIGLGTFLTPWFAWALSAGILAVLSPLLDPSKTCPVPVCFVEWVVGIFDGTEVCFDLPHLLSGLHWWEV